MMNIELEKLYEIFDSVKDESQRMLYMNSFVAACYLHQLGHERAACKLLSSIFDSVGRSNRETLISKIFSSIKGNESKLASAMAAHLELNKLFISKTSNEG